MVGHSECQGKRGGSILRENSATRLIASPNWTKTGSIPHISGFGVNQDLSNVILNANLERPNTK